MQHIRRNTCKHIHKEKITLRMIGYLDCSNKIADRQLSDWSRRRGRVKLQRLEANENKAGARLDDMWSACG